MNIFGRNSKVTINGKTYEGSHISMQGNNVYVDGKLADGVDEKRVEITILCNVDEITSDESIHIKGNVTGNVSAKASVSCDAVFGDVHGGASVNCDDVHGNVTAGTAVNCDNVKGSVKANIVNRS